MEHDVDCRVRPVVRVLPGRTDSLDHALRQINRTQERGKAFAIAGIVISAIAIVIVIITIILAIAVGVYMVNHPEIWNGSYCINGDCVYKDYGDSAFTSLAIMPLAALIG